MNSVAVDKPRSSLLQQWNELWAETADEYLPEAPTWQANYLIFEGCDTARQFANRARQIGDEALICLVEATQQGSGRAGMIVLHIMLPILVTQAGRDSRFSLDDLCSTAWLVIHQHNLSRRLAVLATLCMDTRRWLIRYLEKVSREVPTADLPLTSSVANPAELAMPNPVQIAADLHLITPTVAPVLKAVFVEDCSRGETARRLKISETAARYRSSAGIHRLRKHRDLFLAAIA